MRLFHYLDFMRVSLGGVVRAVLDLAGGAAAAGHDVTVATLDDADAPEPWRCGAPGVPRVVRLGPGTGPLRGLTRGDVGRVRGLLAGVDVAHLHGVWERSTAQVAAACRRARVPYVVTVHGMLDDWCMAQRAAKKRLYLTLIGGRMLRGAAAVHCTAQAEMDQARKWFPVDLGVVIPLPMDLAAYRTPPSPEIARAAYNVRAGVPGLLFLSRLHPKKGVEALIHAAAQLRGGGITADVLIAGSGEPAYEAGIRALALKLDLGPNVRLLGLVTGDLKLSLYRSADLFVLPTHQENFGYVLLEAMACGTPIVTTRGVDIWRELEATGAATIIERDDDAATTGRRLAEVIRPALADLTRLRAAGARGREWVLSTCDAAAVTPRYLGLYERARATGRA
ncbi:MAG: glycosyltransferase [Phycisphaerales bacterium]